MTLGQKADHCLVVQQLRQIPSGEHQVENVLTVRMLDHLELTFKV